MFMKAITTLTLTMCLLTGLSAPAALAETALAPAGAHVAVEQVVVHSPALEGNLEGEAPDRQAIVYLPPDYRQNPDKRYPVIYILHGYNMTAPGFAGLLQAQSGLDGAYAQGLPGVIVDVFQLGHNRRLGRLYHPRSGRLYRQPLPHAGQ